MGRKKEKSMKKSKLTKRIKRFVDSLHMIITIFPSQRQRLRRLVRLAVDKRKQWLSVFHFIKCDQIVRAELNMLNSSISLSTDLEKTIFAE